MASNGRWSPRTERAMAGETRLYGLAFDARCTAETFACWTLLFAGVAGLLGVRARERSHRVAELQREDTRRRADERARAAVKPVPMPAAERPNRVAEASERLADDHQADG
jgi:hypothetical protein